MSDVNRSINIYLNEAEVEASLQRLQKTATNLEAKMAKAASPEEFKKLENELTAVNGKMGTLEKQLSGEMAPTIKQLENGVAKLRNELHNTATGTQEFVDKSKKLNEAQKHLDGVRQQAFGVTKAIEQTGKSAGVFSGLKDKIKDFAGAIPGVGTAITAMLGPLGLVVGAIGLLIGLLGQSAEAADKFQFVMAGVTKVIRMLADITYDFIKNGIGKLTEAFANPKQALIDFGKAIVDHVISHLKGVGVVLEGIATGNLKKFTDGVIQMGTGITNATDKAVEFGNKAADAFNKGYDAAAKLDELIVTQAKFRNEIERTNNAIAEQTTLMKDTTRSDEERLAAATKVIALETANSGRRIKSIQLEINALKEKNAGIKLSSEEEARILDLETAKLQAITAQKDAIRKATLEKAKLERELALKQDLAAVELTAQGIQSIASTAADSADSSFKKITASATDFTKSLGQIMREGFENMQAGLSSFWNEWGQAFKEGVELVGTVVNGVLDLQDAKTENNLRKEKRATDERIKFYKKELDARHITQKQYDKAVEKLMAEQAQKEREAKRKQFKQDKAAKIAMSVINTAMAVVNAFATMPYPASIVMAALAAATGAAQIGIIAAQPVPEFAKGGMLRGRSHSQGGMAVVNERGRKVAELEGDEFIVNKRATAKHIGLLRMINGDTGPNWNGNFPRFDSGGVFRATQVAKFADGGLLGVNTGNVDGTQLMLLQNILEAVQQPQRNYVVFEDVKAQGDNLQRAQSRASFSKS